MTRRSLLWWLKNRRRSVVVPTNICPACNGRGMVRYDGQHMSADGLYFQWALVCDPCQGTGEVQEPATQRPPQALRMAPGWRALPRTDVRPLRMSKQAERPANVIPFALGAPDYEPTTDKAWDQATAHKLMLWAQADAHSDQDSGDAQEEA